MTVCEDPLAKVFGGGEVGVDAEGVGEGRHAKLFREGPPKKGVLVEAMLGVIASSNIDFLASLSTVRKTLSFYLLQRMVSHFI